MPTEREVVSVRCNCVVAAKQHKCIICDAPIDRGQRHYVQVYRNVMLLPRSKQLRQVRYHVTCPQMELPV